MDAKSAREYRHADRLLSESFTPGTWRTREDPFQDVWPPNFATCWKSIPGFKPRPSSAISSVASQGVMWDMLRSWFTPWIFDTPFERAVGFGQSRGYNS